MNAVKTILAVGLILVFAGAAQAQWAVYNDFSDGTAVGGNYLNHASTAGSHTLKDTASVDRVTMDIAVSGGGGLYGGNAGISLSGDALAIFGGICNGDRIYSTDGQRALIMTFTGLDAAKLYDIVLYGARQSYSGRVNWSEISDVDAFTNISHQETFYFGDSHSGPSDPTTGLPAELPPSGSGVQPWVHHYTNINPGADGDIVVTIDGDPAYGGPAYSAEWNVMRFSEIENIPEPATMSLLALGGLSVLLKRPRK